MTDERYPETDDDPGPLDAIVDVLREADVSHREKAVACLGAARSEYRYAVEDGEIDQENAVWEEAPGTSGFLSWARETLPMLDAVLGAHVGK